MHNISCWSRKIPQERSFSLLDRQQTLTVRMPGMGDSPPVPAFVVLSEAASRFPTLGIKCSHVGNQTFPRWEKFQALMARAAALAGVSISILLKIPPSLNKSLETRINTSVLRDEGFSESLPYPSLIPPKSLPPSLPPSLNAAQILTFKKNRKITTETFAKRDFFLYLCTMKRTLWKARQYRT